MSGEWKFRLAEPSDAEAFSRWVVANPQIDPDAIERGTHRKNPTVVTFAVEKDGIVQAFVPVYLQFTLAHLGFNPQADDRDKLRALEMLTDGVAAFAVQYGIREITTLSKEEYPLAQWAMKHNFDLDPRQVFTLDLNKILEDRKSTRLN